ncbi:hypothetical protein FRC20_010327 [Serendipita sp. 405]|nr:hypothetical protein FRC20_010327 [Serendipita sp. 405]
MTTAVRIPLTIPIYRSTHTTKVDKYYPILPPELWKSIIDSIIDEIRHPYRYCRPATFPQYHARFSLADKLENDTTLEDWKSIRSVCWAWKQFAGPQPYLHLRHFQQDAPNEDTLKVYGVYRSTTRCVTDSFGKLYRTNTHG